MTAKLCIAICTYNRAELLPYCLDAIYPQLKENVELLVVDNGTEKVDELCKNYPKLSYIQEEQTGLSFARNTAVEHAQADYILFLDDDAKAYPNFVEESLRACACNYLIFGGVYHPWYHYGQPKWFKDEYASNKLTYTKDSELKEAEYLSGGIMAFHKSVFERIGNFITDIGMRGTQVGYGEESELQDRARKEGIKLMYIPELQMDHLVAKYKLSVNWFLKAYWNRGVDQAKYFKGIKFTAIIKELFIALVLLLKDGIVNSFKLIAQPNYYFQNWQIDSLKKLYKRIGYIYQLINDRK